MTSFSDVRKKQRETAAVISALLSLVFLFVASRVLPNVLNNGIYLNPLFYVGIAVFGLIGFLTLEILESISFLGGGAKVGAGAFILILLVGIWTGGRFTVAFLSGSIMGLFLFCAKSVYAMYMILTIETQPEEPVLSITEMKPLGSLKHFRMEGVGSNFELLFNIIEELRGDSEVIFYARYKPPEYKQLDETDKEAPDIEAEAPPPGNELRDKVRNKVMRFYAKYNPHELKKLDLDLDETMRLYANYMMPLHRVNARSSSDFIKQIYFECSSPEVLERGLINYWLRGHLTGGYTCIVVPYEDDFLKKTADWESGYKETLNIEGIIGPSPWMLKTESLIGNQENYIEVYTDWDMVAIRKRIPVVTKLIRTRPAPFATAVGTEPLEQR